MYIYILVNSILFPKENELDNYIESFPLINIFHGKVKT